MRACVVPAPLDQASLSGRTISGFICRSPGELLNADYLNSEIGLEALGRSFCPHDWNWLLMGWSGRASAPLVRKLWGFEPRKEHVSCHGLLSLLVSPRWVSIWARTASTLSARISAAPSCCASSSPGPSSRNAWPTFHPA